MVPSIQEVKKPTFLRCCLVCNSSEGSLKPSGAEVVNEENFRELFASQICPSAREELTAVEHICGSCRNAVDQWSGVRRSLRQLHAALASQYKASRRQRCAGAFTVTVDRTVVHIPYPVFLTHQRDGRRRPWSDAAHEVALAALQTAGIAHNPPAAQDRPHPPPPPPTHSVGCQTQSEESEQPQPACARSTSRGDCTAWAAPAPLPTPRARLPRQRKRTGSDALGDAAAPAAEPVTPPARAELGCLRGWEGITNVQPSAPPRSAGTHKRVGFEGLKEQAARARDLEETLSILSVADTASLLDRTETLSVFSDTAELGALADDHLTSLDLSAGKEPAEASVNFNADRYAKAAPPSDAPSVSFAEPSTGHRPYRQSGLQKGEDLLREFAETMSNISEGVVLEDLEGYFEEIDRPSAASGRAVPPLSPSRTGDASLASAQTPAASCSACRAELTRQPLRLPANGKLRCHLCRTRFTHLCKLRQHLQLRHPGEDACSGPQRRRRAALARPDRPEQAAGSWRCGDCGRQFSRLTTLRQHEAVHRGGGHPCSHCQKVFPSKSELQRHTDSHRREKRYRCDDCGKTFQISTSLARHRTLHNGKAASCEVCGKCFDRKDTMLKHQETHKTTNEHPCKLCGKLFKQRRILAKHVKLIHGGPGAFQCDVCDKTFRTRYDMEAHSRRVHEGKRLPNKETIEPGSEVGECLDAVVVEEHDSR